MGGFIVSAFSVLGSLFKPTTFAGLFGAAPSVALATLTLTVAQSGSLYASTEARSMVIGALALCLYSVVVALLLARYRVPAFAAALLSIVVWLATSFGLWFLFLR